MSLRIATHTPIKITLQCAASFSIPLAAKFPTSFHLFTHTFLTWRFTPQSVRQTFCLAVSAVLVVVFSQQFRQNGLMLLIQFLGFFSLRPRRHLAKVWKLVLPVWRWEKPRSVQLVLKRVGHPPCSRTTPPVFS